MEGIFLLGSERSGSNLLRTLLGNHTQISAPIAPHLCDVFIKKFKYYLPLGEASRQELLEDINAYVNHDFNEWNLKIPLEDHAISNLNSFVDFLHYSFSAKAMSNDKSAYFSKDNHNHRYALGLLKDIPNAKFVYLYRDPRDHVASWMRTPIHIHTPYQAILKWKEEQEYIFNLKKFYNLPIISVKYENLISNTKDEMTRVLKSLDFQVEESCFDTKKDNKEAKKHPLWKNINKPIKKENYNKFMDTLDEGEINMIETLTSNLMKELEYKPITDQSWLKGNHYFFSLKEIIRTKQSIRKNNRFVNEEMKVLIDKSNFTNKLFAKFK